MTNPGNDLIRSTRSSSSAESTETCAQCGHLVPESSRFCPECGARVPLLRTGEVFEDKYEVVRLMAQGTTTELYEVRHIELGEPRSIKVLRPELFLEENHRLRFRIADAPGASREGATVRELPFRALTPHGYLERHVISAPRSLRDAVPDRDFPASLDAVISKAIEKEREKRFQTAAEFRDALLEARKDVGAVQPKRSSKQAPSAEPPATSVAPVPVPVPAPVAAKPVVPAGVSDRHVTLPDGVQQPRDVAPQIGTTTTLASSAAPRDISAGNTYDPLARKKIRWGTWLSVALLAALVLWGIWIMTRPAQETEAGTLAITATSSDVPG